MTDSVPSERMSGHADTIREALRRSEGFTARSASEAFTALDALVAKNQQLRDALAELGPIARQIVKSNDVVTDPQASNAARSTASMSEQEGIMVLAEWLVRHGAAVAGTPSEDTE